MLKRKLGEVEENLCTYLNVKKTIVMSSDKTKTNESERSCTTNGDDNFTTTGNALLDFFFGIVRGFKIDHETMVNVWKSNPTKMIQILKHARDVRSGKGEKLIIFQALLWLRHHKPKTYVLNIRDFTINLGCFKDLIKLANHQDSAHLSIQDIELNIVAEALYHDLSLLSNSSFSIPTPQLPTNKTGSSIPTPQLPTDETGSSIQDHPQLDSNDKQKVVSISLAAKWAPSEKRQYGSLAKRLAIKLFPQSKQPFKDYRQLLTKLRKHLGIVETFMCQDRWDEIEFSKVPSRAHKILRKAFKKHDPERYTQYIEDCKQGKQKINSTALHPHELVAVCINGTSDDTTEVLWNDMMAKLRNGVTLSSSIAVVDVSGSMEGTPMTVAIALGLIVAELCNGQFKNRVITFDSNPSWHTINAGTSLKEKVEMLKHAPWGGSTDLRATFDLILDMAISFNVAPADMPNTLYIFSDMQFNKATSANQDKFNESTFEYAKRRFSRSRYTLPRIIFWNLSGEHGGVPIQMSTNNTILVSGFSPNLLKLVMEGELSPHSIMEDAIKPYSGFVDESEL